MAEQSYRGSGWAFGPGLSRVIAILLSIILLLIVIWMFVAMFTPLQYCPQCTWFSKTFQGCQCQIAGGSGDPPAGALAECDQQLARGRYSIQGQTAHERYLTETLPTMKPQMYVMVTLRKRAMGSASDADSALGSVAVEVHRPNDADPQNNLDALCSRPTPEATTASANSGGVSEVRWRMFCDLSRLQYDQQEQVTGLLKYRVLIKNWSRESVDYCLVSSCDAQYPAGEACGGGSYGGYPSATASGGGTTGQ